MRARVVAAGVLSVAVLAGCTSTQKASSPLSSTPAPPVSSSSTPAPATSPSSTAPTTPPATRSTTAAPRSTTAEPPATTAAPVQQRSTCSSLAIRILPGGAAAQRQFAAIQFTNTGSSSCVLYGYPTVTLSLGGSRIATAKPASSALSSRRLAPGAVAEAQLNDYVMNCQEKVSDTIHVVAPGSSQTGSRPLQLRACNLQLEPLSAAE